MAPTVPAGLPTIGVVWAKLLVNCEDRGIRPFLVTLNDGKQMCPGVKSMYVSVTHTVTAGLTCLSAVFSQSAAAPTPSTTPSPLSATSAFHLSPSWARPRKLPRPASRSHSPCGASSAAHSPSVASPCRLCSATRPSARCTRCAATLVDPTTACLSYTSALSKSLS